MIPAAWFSKQSKNELMRHCVVNLITAWCFVALVNMLRLSSETFNPVESLAVVSYTNIIIFISIVIAIAVILTVIFLFVRRDILMNGLMFASSFVLGLVIVVQRQETYTCLAVTGLVLLSFTYFAKNIVITDIEISRRAMVMAIAFAAVLIAVFIGVTSYFRYETYSVPNFDGGLFMQMFYYMKNHLTMQTTLERDTLMSHMLVHVSPVFWLLLPIYYVFPYNQTVLVCQGLVLALAVIPLALLCRRRAISRFKTAVICAVYCFMPYVAGGCGYDIHENMFLPLAVFCLLYAFEADSWKCIVFSTLFLLSVKEDAALYAVFTGLYMLISNKGNSRKNIGDKRDKRYIKALFVIVMASLYFVLAVSYVQKVGGSTSTNKFNNLIYGHDGNILGIIPTVLTNPGYVLKEIMSTAKIGYMIVVLVPMMLIPLYCRDYRLYILAGPFVIFNLMPSYDYLHDIGFQYTFGSASLLYYMTIVAIDSDTRHNQLKMLGMCAVATALFFASELTSRFNYIEMYNKPAYQQIYAAIDEALACIPDDAEVTASTFLCSRLARRDIIYEDAYTDKKTEYLALDLRGTEYDYDICEFYESKGYTTLAYTEGVIAVFVKM